MMKFTVLFAMLCLPVSGFSQKVETEKAPAKKKIHPSLVKVKDDPSLPRVLLIGDSISMGYTVPVRERLKGKANVHRIPANGGPTSRGLANIEKWLGDGKWDLIHFNWGIHDLKHMEGGKNQVVAEDYEKNLRTLVARLKETGAKLVFATTTPIPKGKLNPDRTFDDETKYNAIAAKVMKEMNVPINDLHGYMMPRFEEFHKPQDLHFTDEGSAFLADQVAEVIAVELDD